MESARCKAFVAAADTGSFSRAAEQLNYTPSGVSQLVAALEKELNVVLLRRNKKGVSLTPSGEMILPAARALLLQENSLFQMAAEINGLSVGNITIATYPSIAAHWLPRVINGFRTEHPQIGIHIKEGTRQEILRWLEAGAVDMGFLSGSDALPFDWFPLAEDRIVAILPETHILAQGSSYPLPQCLFESLIMPSSGQDEDVTSMFERNGISPKIAISTIEGIAAIAMVESGLGISIMNELVTCGYSGKIIKLPLDPAQSITLGIAIPSLESATPAAAKFVKYATICLTQGKQDE